MQAETKIITRYSETDQMGIVHHSNYAVWAEAGRTDFYPQDTLVVLCRYHKEKVISCEHKVTLIYEHFVPHKYINT